MAMPGLVLNTQGQYKYDALSRKQFKALKMQNEIVRMLINSLNVFRCQSLESA